MTELSVTPDAIRRYEEEQRRIRRGPETCIETTSSKSLQFARAKAAADEVIKATRKHPSCNEVITEVCRVFKVNRDHVLGARRAWKLVVARHVAMYVCRETTGRSLPEIARRFNRDHTTVIHACAKIGGMKDPELQTTISEIIAWLRAQKTRENC